MAVPDINTPATERRTDMTSLSAHHIDFSFAQPFASPSKNPAEQLRNQMRGMRAPGWPSQSQPQPVLQVPPKTPRVRAALVDKRNPAGSAPEFTPLLRSAQRKQMLQQSLLEDKENANAMDKPLAGSGMPNTPAVLRSSYKSPAGGNRLPINSSLLDGGDHTNNSSSLAPGADVHEGTPAPPAASSSMMYDSTPMPQLPKRGEGGAVLDQGNVLTLRDQEAKLDQIQKDNFGLKLKIHFLEEALRKSGNEFHQATVKENVELKTEKVSLEQDLKRQRKRLQDAARELEEYRLKYEEYQAWVKKRHASERESEELQRLRDLAEQSEKAVSEREQELDKMRQMLEDARHTKDGEAMEVQRLKDDVIDLEADVRDRDRQLEEMDEKCQSSERESEELQHLRTLAKQSERAASERDQELDKMRQMLEDARHTKDGEAMEVQRLKDDVQDLEAEVRDRDRQLDEMDEKRHASERDLEEVEHLRKLAEQSEKAAREREQELDRMRSMLEDAKHSKHTKDGEAMEVQRLKDDVQDLEAEVRARDRQLEQKDEQLDSLQHQLDSSRDQLRQKDEQLYLLQDRLDLLKDQLRQKDKQLVSFQDQLDLSREQLRRKDEQLKSLQDQLDSFRDEHKDEQLDLLQDQLDSVRRQLKQKDEELHSLQDQLKTAKRASDEGRQYQQNIGELEAKVEAKAANLREKDAQLETLRIQLQAARLHNTEQATRLQQDIDDLEAELQERDAQLGAQNHKIAAVEIRTEKISSPRDGSTERIDAGIHELEARLRETESRQALEDEILVLETMVQELGERERHRALSDARSSQKHEAELRGLAKQILFLHAKCAREETFRADLTWSKGFFLKQVKLYSQWNQADLRLLQEIGIMPDMSQLQDKRHSLRAVGLMVLGTVRMRRLAREWQGNRKVGESLGRKLEDMHRGKRKAPAGR